MKLMVWIWLLVLGGWRVPKTESSGCPYDFTVASRMIPPSGYQNSTEQITAQGTCCWYAFASFVFAISRHANQTGEVLLDDAGSSRCTDEFVRYVRTRGLVGSTFFSNSSACQIDHLTFTANAGPCRYARLAQIWDTVDLCNASTSNTYLESMEKLFYREDLRLLTLQDTLIYQDGGTTIKTTSLCGTP